MMSFASSISLFLFLALLPVLFAIPPAPFSLEDPPLPHTTHPLKPTSLWGPNLKPPYPTNAWWINAVLDDGAMPIYNKPYHVKLGANGVLAAWPRKFIEADGHYLTQWFEYGVHMGIRNADRTLSHQIVEYDAMSVTAEYTASKASSKSQPASETSSGGGLGSIRVPVVRGSPYVTAVYRGGLAPAFNLVKCSLIGVQVIPKPSKEKGATASPATGSTFALMLNTTQVWIIYFSQSTQVTWNATSLWVSGSSAPAALTVRLAALPNWLTSALSFSLVMSDPAFRVLSDNAKCIPIGGTVETDITDTAMLGTIKWSAVPVGDDKKPGSCQPLILVLPHLRLMLNPKTHRFTKLRYDGILGNMTGVVSDVWSWEEPLLRHSFFALNPPSADRHEAIINQLKNDIKYVGFSPDPYDWGKQVCRFAREALIAEEVNQPELQAKALKLIEEAFEPWYNGDAGEAIMYDATWGGAPPRMGLGDPGADFGAGWYNDHHFHYGYWFYAAAVLTKAKPEWGEKWKSRLLALARDVANPSKQDPYFPVNRFFDWYEGHSMASGLFSFFDGRNQESTSEALNAWYGMALLGTALNDTNLERVGRALLASEMRSSKWYWHSTTKQNVYPEKFAVRKGAGMVWCDKVIDQTWFGAGPIFALGINMIPFTPISELYLTPDWASEAFPVLVAALKDGNNYPEDWRALVFLLHAVLDKQASWDEVANMGIRSDEGNSRSNAMWWIASRPSNPNEPLLYAPQDPFKSPFVDSGSSASMLIGLNGDGSSSHLPMLIISGLAIVLSVATIGLAWAYTRGKLCGGGRNADHEGTALLGGGGHL